MTAVKASAVLDGVHLSSVPATEWRVRARELRHIRESATGVRREVLLATAAGQPLRRHVRTFALTWNHVGALRATVEELLATPGEHTLVLWREEFVTWAGDGVTRELTLPNGWLLAVDALDPLPAEVTAAEIAPQVKIGIAGAALAHSLVDPATFDAGDPPAGEVWFAEGESRCKLGDVPDAGATVYARLVPVYRALQAPDRPEQRLDQPIREPLEFTLLEAG